MPQEIGGVGLAGGGDDLITGGGQQVDADRADAAGGPGYQDRPVVGGNAVADQGLHAHGRGETGGTDRGTLARCQFSKGDHLVGGQPDVLAVAAVAASADVVAVRQNHCADGEFG